MDQYRTSGVIDENAMKEIIGIFVPTWYRWLNRVFFVFSFLMFLLYSIVGRDVGYSCLFLFFMAVFASYPTLLRRRHLKLTLTRMKEQAGSLSLPIESFFNVDGLAIHNQQTDISALLRYEDIAFAKKSKHYFAVMTKGQQFSLIFKDCLTDDQRRSFMADLKRRCPHIKIRK